MAHDTKKEQKENACFEELDALPGVFEAFLELRGST